MTAEWREFRKKVTTKMVQVSSAADLPTDRDDVWPHEERPGFVTKTREGDLFAPWGAWLAIDSGGHAYPIAADEHARIYEPILVTADLPGVEAAVKSPCCHVGLQAQATGCATHPQFGNGVSVHVACSKCDTPYGKATHVFGDGNRGAATVIP